MNNVFQNLKQRGYKLTPQRRRIVSVLARSPEPLTAQQVYQVVRKDFPRISLDTVYRNLELLRETGMAIQINLLSRESARFEFQSQSEHHHHLVCMRCGDSICLEYCPLSPTALAQAANHNFQVKSHAFELYGYCEQCQTA